MHSLLHRTSYPTSASHSSHRCSIAALHLTSLHCTTLTEPALHILTTLHPTASPFHTLIRFVFRDAYNLNKRNFSVCLTATWGEPCANTEFASLPFCDRALSADARADDLLSRATTDELSNMLSNDGIKHAWLPRLGVATNNTHQEALHGTCASGGGPAPSHTPGSLGPGTGFGTSFPHATALAATLNRTLWGMVGRVIGIESRAMSNQGVGGLFLRTPNLNMARDPRWGASC